jgi:hypothetical protein
MLYTYMSTHFFLTVNISETIKNASINASTLVYRYVSVSLKKKKMHHITILTELVKFIRTVVTLI